MLSSVREISKRGMGMQRLQQQKGSVDDSDPAKVLRQISEELECDNRTVKMWNRKLCDGEDTVGRSKGSGIYWCPRGNDAALIKLTEQDLHATIDELWDRLEEICIKHSWSAVQRMLNKISRGVNQVMRPSLTRANKLARKKAGQKLKLGNL